MEQGLSIINERVKEESAFIQEIYSEIGKVLVGQTYLVERLLIGLLTKGHVLLEGVPGLAKTLSVKTLAEIIDTKFQRIQFTPDLLPGDLTGTIIYNPREGTFTAKKGPLFSNIILADEINRAPAKVQSALLEAMQEKQVTIGDQTYPIEEPFIVLATQNPIEQEGTYTLPEAQADRFLLKLKISYPPRKEERQILERVALSDAVKARKVVNPEKIKKAQSVVREIYVDEKIKNYILDIVFATRFPADNGLADLKDFISYGVSPRATINLTSAGQAYAFLQRRGYVTPEDIKTIGMDVLRHRLITTYEADAEGVTSEDIVKKIFDTVPVP